MGYNKKYFPNRGRGYVLVTRDTQKTIKDLYIYIERKNPSFRGGNLFIRLTRSPRLAF